MGDHKDYDAGVLGMVVYPNFWMDAVSDYMWTMRFTAVSSFLYCVLILPGWWIIMQWKEKIIQLIVLPISGK